MIAPTVYLKAATLPRQVNFEACHHAVRYEKRMPVFDTFPEGRASPRVFLWADATRNFGYVPDHNYDANNCEYYADGAAGSIFSHHQAYNDTINIYFRVNRHAIVDMQGGAILHLGVYVREVNGDSYAPAAEPGRIREVGALAEDDKLSLCLAAAGRGPFLEVCDFAFFLDVRRSYGSVDRLWLKNGARDFSLCDIKDFRTVSGRHGALNEYYVRDASPLFHQRTASRG